MFLSSQNIIDSYDKNKDGLLDYAEFLSYMMDRERKWKIYFHDLDKNKCGEQSEPYLLRILHIHVHISQRDVRKCYKVQ